MERAAKEYKKQCEESIGILINDPGALSVLHNHVLIRKNTILPAKRTAYLKTAVENQKSAYVTLTEGEGANPQKVKELAKLEVMLPPNLQKWEPYTLEVQLNTKEQILVTVKVTDKFYAETYQVNRPESGVKLDPLVKRVLSDNEIIGMEGLVRALSVIKTDYDFAKKKSAKGGTVPEGNGYHAFIKGPAGVGLSTAAKTYAEALPLFGCIDSDKKVFLSHDEVVGNTPEDTTANLQKAIDRVQGGVVIIEHIEEYYHENIGDIRDADALSQIAKAIKKAEKECTFVITATGETGDKFAVANPLFLKLFEKPGIITIDAYTPEENLGIFTRIANKNDFVLTPAAEEAALERIRSLMTDKSFEGVDSLKNLLFEARVSLAERLKKKLMAKREDYSILCPADFKVNVGADRRAELDRALLELESLIGVENAKQEIKGLVAISGLNEKLKNEGMEPKELGNLNLLFVGNPGTGKATVARLFAKICYLLKLLPSDKFVRASSADLISGYTGQTAKTTKDVLEEAAGGVLFIENLSSLNDSAAFGQEALSTLLSEAEKRRDSLIVIMAGTEKEITELKEANPSFESCFGKTISFPDYNDAELNAIFERMLAEKGLVVNTELKDTVQSFLTERRNHSKNFGNAAGVRGIVEELARKQSYRISNSLKTEEKRVNPFELTKEDFGIVTENKKTVEDYLAELDSMIGMEPVKEEVRSLVAFATTLKKRKEMGLETVSAGTLHMVFTGNAGTGKTTVARIIGNIYRELGLLSNGELHEVHRSDLVGEYIGQTEPKTKACIEKAEGGVLFIDEAYTLSNGSANDYGRQAIETLLPEIENRRETLCVIIAGYSDEMNHFLDTNQGLAGRFNKIIDFPDFSSEELVKIFRKNLTERKFVTQDVDDRFISEYISRNMATTRDFANARGVRNLVEKVIKNQFARLSTEAEATREQLVTILPEDF